MNCTYPIYIGDAFNNNFIDAIIGSGVAAIFMSRIKNNNPPLIFEDGNQSRDFVSVHDVVQACDLSIKKNSGN